MNALLCGAGHNMRKILKKPRLLCDHLGITLRELLGDHRFQIAPIEVATA